MTARRPRSTAGVLRAFGSSRVGYATVDGGDLEIVYLIVASKAEADLVNDSIRAAMPTLAGPRTLTRRRQVVALVQAASRIVDTRLSATEVARLHEWARSRP